MSEFRKSTLGYILSISAMASKILSFFMSANKSIFGILSILSFLFYIAALVYFFMVIHRIHKVVREASNQKYPISPARAVGYSFIPIYSIYWMFKCPGEIALFLNHVSREDRLKKNRWGWLFFLGGLANYISGFGFLIYFMITDEMVKKIKSTLESAKLPVEDYTEEKYKSSAGIIIVFITIIVAIIALLAAIAIPNFIRARDMARQNTLKASQTQKVTP